MALSLVGVGAKITAALFNALIGATNSQGSTGIAPTTVVGGSAGPAGVVTFSAVSSVSLNGIFSSAYEDYDLEIDITAHSAGAQVQARLRLAGTDAAGATDYVSTTNAASPTGTATSVWVVGAYASAVADFIALRVSGPALARITRFRAEYQSTGATTARAVGQTGGDHALANAYDGLTIVAGSGTITGTIRVYGRNKN